MPGENLTRKEAQSRAAIIDVQSYKIELDLTTSETTFASKTTVTFTSKLVGAETFIDAITSAVHSVTLNGTELDVSEVNDGVRIQLPNLQARNELVVVADANYMNTGEGLHRFVDPADGNVYLYTQFEVPDSRRVFAVFEQPDLKATFEFVVTAPNGWKVMSNQPSPTPKAISGDKAIWSFEPTPRLSSYVTAIIAGPYHEERSELTNATGRVIPLGVYCRQSMAKYLEADYMFAKTRQGFEFFEKQFGVEYPFAKYDQLFVPEFNAGAMENAGAVTFTERYIFRSQPTVALQERRVITLMHELAHMWFGDLVTMRWWNDLWLNESFAEYAAELAVAEATEWTTVWATFAGKEKSWAYQQDQLPSTHPIVAPINDLHDVEVNFDGITYAKGASALKQLVAWVGQERFMAGVGAYFRKHAFGNTELKDLLVELEATSGKDLKKWSALWLQTAGVNTLVPSFTTDSDGKILDFKVEQSAVAEYPTIRPHQLRIGFYNLIDGSVVRTHQVEIEIDSEECLVEALVGLQRPDLVLLNDDDLTYAKIRFDADSLDFAKNHLHKIQDPLARAQVWLSMWNEARDAKLPPREFIDLILEHIAFEDQSMLVSTFLGYLYNFVFQYTSPENRVKTIDDVANSFWKLIQASAPASDMQLQLVTYYGKFARASSHQENIQRILAGELVLPGLDLGNDLRWSLLAGLTNSGAATQEDVEVEFAKDSTANGQKGAAAALSALPDYATKRKVWDTMVHTEEYSNAQTSAACLDLGRAFDPAVLEPFVDLYFEDLQTIWDNKTYHICEYLIPRLFPMNVANQALADKTKAYLKANPDQPWAFRRMIVENLASLERALAAQKLDKQ